MKGAENNFVFERSIKGTFLKNSQRMSELLSHNTSKRDSIDVEISKHYDLPEEFKDQSMDMDDFKQEDSHIIEDL